MPWRLYLAIILLAFLLTYVIILSYNIVEIHVVTCNIEFKNHLTSFGGLKFFILHVSGFAKKILNLRTSVLRFSI